MFKISLVALIFVLCNACRTFNHVDENSEAKIVYGRSVEAGMREFDPVVKLSLGRGSCTGTHIGNGIILTAAHCEIAGREMDAQFTLTILGKDQNTILRMPAGSYDVLYPPSFRTTQVPNGRGTIDRHEPDLILISPKRSRDREAIRALPKVVVAGGSLRTQERGASIAGYGLSDYFIPDLPDKLQFGTVNIVEVTDVYYKLRWDLENTAFVGAASGDSGGPVYKLVNGEIHQYGVASYIEKDISANDTSMTVDAYYSRLDSPTVREWLETSANIEFGGGRSDRPDRPTVPRERTSFDSSIRCTTPRDERPYYVVKIDFTVHDSGQISKKMYSRSGSSTPVMDTTNRLSAVNDLGGRMIFEMRDGGVYTWSYLLGSMTYSVDGGEQVDQEFNCISLDQDR